MAAPTSNRTSIRWWKGSFRDLNKHLTRVEWLNAHWLLTLDDARSKIEDWPKNNNEVRPHSAIGNKPLATLIKSDPVRTAHRAGQCGNTPAG